MKTYKGTAKVKDDSTYVYRGHTLEIVGVYSEYQDGKGHKYLPDGSRDYKISLVGTEFFDKYGKSTSILCKHLENIDLYETIELPLTEEETLDLIQFARERQISYSSEEILESFITANTKKSVLPIINYQS